MADDPKKVILARRAYFIAAALTSASIGVASSIGACGGEAEAPPRDGGADAAPQPCLRAPPPDASPQPCLGMQQPDASPDAATPDAGDAEPQPCLRAPAPDSG
jgi:hypothetical protein